jgi:hypothetical protein
MTLTYRKQAKYILLAILVGFGFCLMSCASSHESIITSPIKTQLSQYKNITVSVTCSTADPIADEERDLLVKEICMGLEQTGKFQYVNESDPSGQRIGELLVKADITKINRVSRAARVMVGGMAGQAAVELKVQLLDPKEDKLIGETNVTGKSSGGTVFAGTTEDAIKEAAKGCITFVVSAY